jgi:lipoyl(octanoyl) transferase
MEWRVSDRPVAYGDAVDFMELRAAAIREGIAPETIWLVEHPPVYTAGTSARPEDLLDDGGIPVVASGRGGRFTYHGPGQRVIYVMLDLRRRGCDVRRFVSGLEDWIIRALARFNVRGERRPGQVGIWIDRGRHGGRPGEEAKIAAIGVRVRRWVTYHGAALNVDLDLAPFAGILPCGIADLGVTSLLELGVTAGIADVDLALMATFAEAFGISSDADVPVPA